MELLILATAIVTIIQWIILIIAFIDDNIKTRRHFWALVIPWGFFWHIYTTVKENEQ